MPGSTAQCPMAPRSAQQPPAVPSSSLPCDARHPPCDAQLSPTRCPAVPRDAWHPPACPTEPFSPQQQRGGGGVALSKLRGGPREVVGTQIWAAGAERSRRPNLDAAERGWGASSILWPQALYFPSPRLALPGQKRGRKLFLK